MRCAASPPIQCMPAGRRRSGTVRHKRAPEWHAGARAGTDEFEPLVRRTGVDVVESSGAIHFQEGFTADGADLVRDGREGSTRLAVHHHQIQNLGQDPHLLVAFIATPRVPAMGAGMHAEWVACLKSEGSDWVSFRSRCSPRPAATHASDVLFLIGCVAHAPGKLTQMLCKSSQQAPPVWIRRREQISIAVGRQVLRSRGATVLWSVPWDCLENFGAESHETCRVARLPVAPPCISRRPAHSLSHQLVAAHRADVHDVLLAFIAHEIASSLKVRVIWSDLLDLATQLIVLAADHAHVRLREQCSQRHALVTGEALGGATGEYHTICKEGSGVVMGSSPLPLSRSSTVPQDERG